MIKEVNIKTTNPFARRLEYVIEDKVVGYLEYSLIYSGLCVSNIV